MATAAQIPTQKISPVLTWIFTWRGTLAAIPLLFALVWTRGETNDPALTWSLGLALMLLGTAVRIWAQQHIHHQWERPLPLTGSGPYQMMRNPLYVGNTLIIVGGTICAKLLWLAPIALVWCAVLYSVIVRHEERDLLRVHGEPYRLYQSAVSRWFPRSLKRPAFINQYIGKAVFAELRTLLVILPFVAKDLLLSTPLGQSLLHNFRPSSSLKNQITASVGSALASCCAELHALTSLRLSRPRPQHVIPTGVAGLLHPPQGGCGQAVESLLGLSLGSFEYYTGIRFHPHVLRSRPAMEKAFHVYILSSESGVLYLGVTNDLPRRFREHHAGKDQDSFSHRYQTKKLVWFEPYGRAIAAIEREKQIKRWRREKKVRLIEKTNPHWQDLSHLLR